MNPIGASVKYKRQFHKLGNLLESIGCKASTEEYQPKNQVKSTWVAGEKYAVYSSYEGPSSQCIK